MNAPIHVGAALSDRLTPMQLSQTICSGVSHARRVGLPDWMGAVDALIEEAVNLNVCFSSGELSAYIRTYRPDLVFSASRDVGAHVRARFESKDLPAYTSGPILQRPRKTMGYSASPVGIKVYVYGPDERSINTHLFEVQIPRPGGTIPTADALPAAPVQAIVPVQDPAPIKKRKTRRKARKAQRTRTSTRRRTTVQVHTDRRLCVPRWAFAALGEKLGQTINGGDDVFVSHADGVVIVSLSSAPQARKHQLVASRCRLLFTARGRDAYVPNTSYSIQITADSIRIDVSKAA